MTTHKLTGMTCAVCNLAGFPREIVGYRQGRLPYVTIRWDVMGDPRKRVPICQTCADWREVTA